MSANKLLQAAAGAAGESVYVEDVFSTYLYEGNDSTNQIQNGLDLSGEGGMVWIKSRSSGAMNHKITDTERGVNKNLTVNYDYAQDTDPSINSFNSDGFTLNTVYSDWNDTGHDYVSWSFRKQEGFFDVVTYTGNGAAGHTISHNLGSKPGLMIIKNTAFAEEWTVYHRSEGATKALRLDNTQASSTSSSRFNNTEPTATEFTVGAFESVNRSGDTIVAYLFAHDDQLFGDDSDEAIIKCGSVTTTSGGYFSENLGFEPQWVLLKTSSEAGAWYLTDIMRGYVTYGSSGTNYLTPNSSDAEGGISNWGINSTGFQGSYGGASGIDLIYIAIRRPMKTPESGTEVFAIDSLGGTSPNPPGFNGVLVDLAWKRVKNTTDDWYSQSRLTGTGELKLNATDSESTADTSIKFDYQDGWLDSSSTLSTQLSWMFKRGAKCFDVVAYEGNGSPSNTARRDLNHNLGVTPELAILKRRDATSEWQVGANGTSLYLNLSNGSAGTYTHSSYFNATDFDVEGWVTEANNNVSGSDYIVYLFATLAGVSKVGSYTGTGSDLNVDCGFSAGARFILIKRTDSTGDWYVYDSTRGIVTGNDPYLLINSTAAEVTNTDYIDPLNAGFTVTSSAPAALNNSGGTYIFLAIA